jgi:endoglucanase
MSEISLGYKESALKAWNWAESQIPDRVSERGRGGGSSDARCLAAAELYRLTGEEKYHKIFLSTTRFKEATAPFYFSPMGPNGDAQGQAGWTYLRNGHVEVDKKIQENIKVAMVRDADRMTENCSINDFKWAGAPNRQIRWGALSMPESQALCRAHFVTQDPKYLEAVVLSTLTGAGANPVNMCYVTGVGSRWPEHPLHEDSRNTRQPLYEGITLGGPTDVMSPGQPPTAPRFFALLYPEARLWPPTESFFDVFTIAPMNEYTVHQTMLPTSFVWGYLAARY